MARFICLKKERNEELKQDLEYIAFGLVLKSGVVMLLNKETEEVENYDSVDATREAFKDHRLFWMD